MLLIDNINLLRARFPSAWKNLNFTKEVDQKKLQAIPSRSSVPTLLFKTKEREVYVHSKYDPLREAEQIIKSYELGDYEHVLFYGIGLGYHIEDFLTKYPSVSFSLYESNYDILRTFLSTRSLEPFFTDRLKEFYFENGEEDTQENIARFFEKYDVQKVLVVILPCYERICPENLHRFSEAVKQVIKQRKNSFDTNAVFEKRWIINSLVNLPKVIRTPNILHDINREKVKDKPVLLISAGPSLQYSIEEVRKIKENGFAYIFSVGSAINALLANDIYPDAVCTYDPGPQNYKAFTCISDKGIDSIPMIFGSSVGFETLEDYPGLKLHMITSQDTVAPMLLKHAQSKEIEKVNDAPSIAVVTLQMLYKLGFNPVYLVGQNLAYLDNKMYSQGINYDFRPSQLSEQEQKQALQVEDVYGNIVNTNYGFNQMRQTFEKYIEVFTPKMKVINTTKGGANIDGAPYISLEDIIETELNTKVVEENWFSGEPNYQKDYLLKQVEVHDKNFRDAKQAIASHKATLEQIQKLHKQKNEKKLELTFAKFEKAFNNLRKNIFYKNILESMNRVHCEILNKRLKDISLERDIMKKANIIFSEFDKYISLCEQDIEKIDPIWRKLTQDIHRDCLKN